jgi:hypothetical protein
MKISSRLSRTKNGGIVGNGMLSRKEAIGIMENGFLLISGIKSKRSLLENSKT